MRLIKYLKPSALYYCNSHNLQNMVYLLTPPESVRGMTILNREAFTTTIEVPCLNLGSEINNSIMTVIKKYLLKLRKYKSTENINGNLIAQLDPEKVEQFEDISESDRKIISKFTKTIDKMSITITYNNWSAAKILRAVLPLEIEMPTSFTKVGDILHLNLRDNQLPYKLVIGQIYLDCIPQTKTVVNKLNNIETEFRNFQMEILAGDENTVTTVKENKCQFTFDFAKVYWNSRLCTEHTNLLGFMSKGDVLYDVFAGVGPFSIPAAKKGIQVLANDLNPDSFRWLELNIQANKAKNISCFNKDGRDFLRNDVKSHLLKRRNENMMGNEHIAMNLPAIANEFLDVLQNWMNEQEVEKICKSSPLVHLYCFVKIGKDEDPKPAAQLLVERSLGVSLVSQSLKDIHNVRNVAPNKEMMRVSFYLTKEMMKCEEPIAMVKNKKASKTKNVFKVQTKKSKVKTLNKDRPTKKKDLNNIKKRSSDRIKAIDQQLVNVRNNATSGKVPAPKKTVSSLKNDKMSKKSQKKPVMDNEVMNKLKI